MSATRTRTHKAETLTVTEAAKRSEDAARRVDELTVAVTSGDTSVSLDELNDARDAAEFAVLQLQGAKARERREAEEKLHADVDALQTSYRQRASETFAEVADARSKAVDALSAYLDAVDAVEKVRADAHGEWVGLRPEDVPLDGQFDDQLPGWYRAANPNKDHAIPRLDWFKAGLGLVRDTLKDRHVGMWREDRAQMLRTLRAFVSAQESAMTDAQKRIEG